ncbi:hypothetical protein DSM104443_01075 [Usitatibacter rugosus]|uniref:Serine aminopeptidase S33 domain-containing protein n=1 Tax=Usitatibacter rugosus TaxID=2732067 RepID=A0A6M4GU60_9PROT|nr:alpha/beta fold hydrolase [Usitatibacter rugosus]QJR10024.1 hypothetical protein DSM104443_01075 [Usitatibacter rugosus]
MRALSRILPALFASLLLSAGAAEQGVSMKTPTGELFGTELLPEGTNGPLPVVLIHAGSGPTDRDGNTKLAPGPNNSLKYLAEGLAAQGVASVRIDKRGIGQSAPAVVSESMLRFETYVDDTAAWVAKLKSDARFSKVIVVGHSEGSLIGMLAAAKAGAEGFVSIAGVGRPADDVLREQLRPKLPPTMFDQNERVLLALKQGRTIDDVPLPLQPLYRPSVQPYLISWFRYDPVKAIAAFKGRVLIVQGTTDIQVTVDDAKRLAAARPDAKLLIVPGMNHVLKKVGADMAEQVASYGDPKLPIPAEVIEAVARFVKN